MSAPFWASRHNSPTGELFHIKPFIRHLMGWKRRWRTSFFWAFQNVLRWNESKIITAILQVWDPSRKQRITCHSGLNACSVQISWNGRWQQKFSRRILLTYHFSLPLPQVICSKPSFLSFSPPFCYFTWRCRCERERPWKNIWFRKLVMKESTEWPLHLVIQWQMDLQFSARLSGNKGHFHFRQEAASVQSSSIRLFKQLQTLHTSLAWLLQLPQSRWVLLYIATLCDLIYLLHRRYFWELDIAELPPDLCAALLTPAFGLNCIIQVSAMWVRVTEKGTPWLLQRDSPTLRVPEQQCQRFRGLKLWFNM